MKTQVTAGQVSVALVPPVGLFCVDDGRRAARSWGPHERSSGPPSLSCLTVIRIIVATWEVNIYIVSADPALFPNFTSTCSDLSVNHACSCKPWCVDTFLWPHVIKITTLNKEIKQRFRNQNPDRKMSSNQYRKSHWEDKTILRPSYFHNGMYYTGKTTFEVLCMNVIFVVCLAIYVKGGRTKSHNIWLESV